MVARNDITGDAIQTKGTTSSYRDNYDNIFRKGNEMTPSVESMKVGTCGCGRSPTGDCIGWHALSEEKYLELKEQHAGFTGASEADLAAARAQLDK
jgi:hypothetical protein